MNAGGGEMECKIALWNAKQDLWDWNGETKKI